MRKSFSRQEGAEALSIGKVKGRPGSALFGEATLTRLAVGHGKGRLSATETLRHSDDLATGYYSVHTNADARAGTTSPRSVDDCTTRVSWPAREAEEQSPEDAEPCGRLKKLTGTSLETEARRQATIRGGGLKLTCSRRRRFGLQPS